MHLPTIEYLNTECYQIRKPQFSLQIQGNHKFKNYGYMVSVIQSKDQSIG